MKKKRFKKNRRSTGQGQMSNLLGLGLGNKFLNSFRFLFFRNAVGIHQTDEGGKIAL